MTSLYSVGLEVFVRAGSSEDARLIAGEHFGSNLPDEIEDFIVQDAEPVDKAIDGG